MMTIMIIIKIGIYLYDCILTRELIFFVRELYMCVVVDLLSYFSVNSFIQLLNLFQIYLWKYSQNSSFGGECAAFGDMLIYPHMNELSSGWVKATNLWSLIQRTARASLRNKCIRRNEVREAGERKTHNPCMTLPLSHTVI